MTDQHEHIPSLDCWCNPLVVTASSKTLAPYSGTIVMMTPVGLERVALHIEPKGEESS